MPKYEVEADVYQRRKFIVDIEDGCNHEEFVKQSMDIGFPEWVSDDESEYVPYSLGFELRSMRRVITTHDLKCWTEPFNAIASGKKKFEFRLNDRDYQVGDKLLLREWDPVKKVYTGNVIKDKHITYILIEGFGLPEGYCIMSLGDDK